MFLALFPLVSIDVIMFMSNRDEKDNRHLGSPYF